MSTPPPEDRIQLLIVEHQPILREGLKRVLSEWSDMQVIAENETIRELNQMEVLPEVDVVLVAMARPDIRTLRALRRMHADSPALRSLILGASCETHQAVRSLRAGASGYVTLDGSPAELAEAIRCVSRGATYLPRELGSRMALELVHDGGRPPHERLSSREYEVMCLIARGKTVSGIAKQLVLSPKTVSTHRANILRKMELAGNGEIIRYAIEEQLV